MVGCGGGCHLPVQSAVAEYRESLMTQRVAPFNGGTDLLESLVHTRTSSREALAQYYMGICTSAIYIILQNLVLT